MKDWSGIRVLITGGAGLTSSRAPQARRESPRDALSVIGVVDTASPADASRGESADAGLIR
jgi:hypothetical protein